MFPLGMSFVNRGSRAVESGAQLQVPRLRCFVVRCVVPADIVAFPGQRSAQELTQTLARRRAVFPLEHGNGGIMIRSKMRHIGVPMKRLLPLILTLATGCSTMQSDPVAPHHLDPPEEFQHDPAVVFMGDMIAHGWLASGVLKQHPRWIDKSSTTLETSASMLARFQADVIDQHPDVVHILCCQGDMGTTAEYCPGDPPGNVCDNVQQMFLQAQAVGIKVVIGSITPWGDGPLAMQIDPNYGFRGADIADFNVDLIYYLQASFAPTVQIVDYHGALAIPGPNGMDGIDRDDGTDYQPALTTDGVNPDAAGYAIMTTMAEQAIQEFQVGGTKRTSNLIRLNK
jgi:lysophospholipase L1-like esterase